MTIAEFWVPGNPIPKQSYRAVRGGGYTDPRVLEWQNQVLAYALPFKNLFMSDDKLCVEIYFVRADKRRADLDNLCKAIMDACKGVIFPDDDQVIRIVLEKTVLKRRPGAMIKIWKLPLPYRGWMPRGRGVTLRTDADGVSYG